MNKLKEQAKFCNELWKRLQNDISKTPDNERIWWIDGRSRIRNDIIRLRRELLALSKMFDYDYDDK